MTHAPTPAAMATRKPARTAPAWDRHTWEEALLAATLPHHGARLLGWGLAHLAPTSGQFRAGTSRDAGYLGQALRLSAKQLHMGFSQLERAGLLARAGAAATDGPRHVLAQAFTLTLPSATAAARTESDG
ncbi:hypothetical protein AB0D38_36855 [Streptomyces sp. NPDC048279]|uniref:hypothetical protein n=1 Tax=Streptomyces sp. NPDC048279 TaxID=3154714 RepID=UPI00344ADC2F